MAVLPEHKLGVIVLSNSTTAQGVVSKIAEGTLKLALEAKLGITQPAQAVREVKTIPLTAGDISAYEGYFDTLIGLVKVSGKGGDLHAEIMGQKLELMKLDERQFGVRFKLFGFIPLKIGALEELNLSLHKIDGHDVLSLNLETAVGGKYYVASMHWATFVGANLFACNPLFVRINLHLPRR